MTRHTLLPSVTRALVIAALMMASAHTQAAPGNLPKTPLYLTNAVEPNVFFTLDDSGSMEMEILIAQNRTGYSTFSGLPTIAGSTRYYVLPTLANGIEGWSTVLNFNAYVYTAPSEALVHGSWVVRTHHANALYYNPDITYVPWAGSDASGNPMFTDADPRHALLDPTNPGVGAIDLTQPLSYWSWLGNWQNDTVFPAVYYTWTDDDGDGVVENSDSHQRMEITPSNAPFPSGRTYTEELQNFANWFQYYRKRSYVAKAALGLIINDTDFTRMGYDLFNSGLQQNATTMSDPVAKRNLLTGLYNQVFACGPGGGAYPNTCFGTPGRSAMDRVGRLFEGRTHAPSPILNAAQGGECQQNFNIYVSDGFWNGWTPNGIGNADGDNNSPWDGNANQSIDGGNYADNLQVTLADVAMHFYERDLSALNDRVPVNPGVDEASHQHLVTYTVGIGIQGALDPNNLDPLAPGFNWPNPMDIEDDDRVDDMVHAAYNGRGLSIAAQNPMQLYQALSTAIDDIAQRTATAAAVAVNSAQLTAQSVVYIAQYNSNRWQGRLFAYPIVDTQLGILGNTPDWEANQLLTNRDLISSPRQILTWNGSQGTAFQWSSMNLSPAMINDLRTDPNGTTSSSAVGQARLDYLRGDRSNENGGYGFRSRPSLLGDLVNSAPVYVGKPTLKWPDTAPFPSTPGSLYSEFKNGAAANRQKIVYIGSNDGMLHAFDAVSGEEVFAYIPNLIASTGNQSGYHYLTDPNYTHNWYVDLTPTLSDIYANTVGGSGWRTVLIGGLRGGGRGLFALDVTDPSMLKESNASNVVMWEFSNADDINLGYTYSEPVIALANNGRWVAIFGNGYNDAGDGQAKLFILDIEAGQNGWSPGDYTVLTTGVGTPSNRNGLSSPALADIDGNGTVDRVYAGDLQGNLWVFDLSGATSSSWSVAYTNGGTTPAPLFKTQAQQPITAKPVLAKHPTIPDQTVPSNAPNLMVFFGTGQFLVDSDKLDTSTQSFYGVWDRGDQNLSTTDLVQQQFVSSLGTRILTQHPVDYVSKHGWYLDLPTPGERAVTTPVARGDSIFFNTYIPVNDPCQAGGYGFKFAISLLNGGTPVVPVMDTNNDKIIDRNDTAVAIRQDDFLPEPVFIEDLAFTGKTATKVVKLPKLPTGRFSWQELLK